MSERAAMPGDVLLRDYTYSTYVYYAKTGEGETVEVVTAPSFWAHMAKRLRVNDRIEIIADNGKWEWHGRVRCKGAVEVFLRPIFEWESDGDEPAPAQVAAYVVQWAGPQHKWRIQNDAGDILKHGFTDEASADQYLADYKAGRIRREAA